MDNSPARLKIKSFDDMDHFDSEYYSSTIKSPLTTTTISATPLKTLCLRGNHMCGSILIGRYNHLTHLEVCENNMEVLDLSALQQLETLNCSQNQLRELYVHGRNLTLLRVGNNNLSNMLITQTPQKLTHADLSHNEFNDLPSWLGSCTKLHTLRAHHNRIQCITEFLLAYEIDDLHELDLHHNKLSVLNRIPKKLGSLKLFYVNGNALTKWPDNFFAVTANNLKVLNISSNKLESLAGLKPDGLLQLEEFYLSNNYFKDDIFNIILQATRLRILHFAYNKISILPDMCVRKWPEIEVLVLSGNRLQKLPTSISSLVKLRELRVHSNNLLHFTLNLSDLEYLRVLDLAHNHLDHINLLHIMPKSLKYLDLSSNLQLQVDESQVKACQRHKNWSLVDVSGKNRQGLPTTKLSDHGSGKEEMATTPHPQWSVGFSETPGESQKLTIRQLRASSQSTHSNTGSALFGLFDSTPASFMRSTFKLVESTVGPEGLRNAFEEITQSIIEMKKQQNPGGVTLCHIGKEVLQSRNYVRSDKTRKYILRVVNCGKNHAYVIRKTTHLHLCLTSTEMASITDLTELTLSNADEYLVICNEQIWNVMSVEDVAKEIRREDNVLLSAKRVQDIAQSFGAKGNLSVIVVKFKNIGTDVDKLIKELKQTTARRMFPAKFRQTFCRNPYDCEQNTPRHPHTPTIRSIPVFNSTRSKQPIVNRSNRSSPSGQSDQALSSALNDYAALHDYARAEDPLLEEEGSNLGETDSSVLSEEQFKCWEYILEQNTQLLFDKELNTISKAMTANKVRGSAKSNLLKNYENKFISNSSPQLLCSDNMQCSQYSSTTGAVPQPHQLSFMGKHFGSCRSFNTNSGDTTVADSNLTAVGRDLNKLSDVPNAAYFGSLQRFVPYNLGYNFALTEEMGFNDEDIEDFSDEDNRMRKYWGVATTEL